MHIAHAHALTYEKENSAVCNKRSLILAFAQLVRACVIGKFFVTFIAAHDY